MPKQSDTTVLFTAATEESLNEIQAICDADETERRFHFVGLLSEFFSPVEIVLIMRAATKSKAAFI